MWSLGLIFVLVVHEAPCLWWNCLRCWNLLGRIAVTSSRCPISPSASEQWDIGISLSVSLHSELLTLTSCFWPTSHKFKFRAWGPPFLSNLFALLICSFPPPPPLRIRRRTQMHSITKPCSLYSPVMCCQITLFWKRGNFHIYPSSGAEMDGMKDPIDCCSILSPSSPLPLSTVIHSFLSVSAIAGTRSRQACSNIY